MLQYCTFIVLEKHQNEDFNSRQNYNRKLSLLSFPCNDVVVPYLQPILIAPTCIVYVNSENILISFTVCC